MRGSSKIIKVQLEKNLPNLIGKEVNVKETVVGKVIEYDIGSGLATLEIDDDLEKILCSKLDWNPIAGHNIGISSRNK